MPEFIFSQIYLFSAIVLSAPGTRRWSLQHTKLIMSKSIFSLIFLCQPTSVSLDTLDWPSRRAKIALADNISIQFSMFNQCSPELRHIVSGFLFSTSVPATPDTFYWPSQIWIPCGKTNMFIVFSVFNQRLSGSRRSSLAITTCSTRCGKTNIPIAFSVFSQRRLSSRHFLLATGTCENPDDNTDTCTSSVMLSTGLLSVPDTPDWPTQNPNFFYRNQFVLQGFCFQPASSQLQTLRIVHNN